MEEITFLRIALLATWFLVVCVCVLLLGERFWRGIFKDRP